MIATTSLNLNFKLKFSTSYCFNFTHVANVKSKWQHYFYVDQICWKCEWHKINLRVNVIYFGPVIVPLKVPHQWVEKGQSLCLL